MVSIMLKTWITSENTLMTLQNELCYWTLGQMFAWFYLKIPHLVLVSFSICNIDTTLRYKMGIYENKRHPNILIIFLIFFVPRGHCGAWVRVFVFGIAGPRLQLQGDHPGPGGHGATDSLSWITWPRCAEKCPWHSSIIAYGGWSFLSVLLMLICSFDVFDKWQLKFIICINIHIVECLISHGIIGMNKDFVLKISSCAMEILIDIGLGDGLLSVWH